MLVGSRVWSTIWKILLDRERGEASDEPLSGTNPTVLVIGGAGYVGSALLPKLLEKGYKVRLFDLFMYGDEPIADLIN
ncbi:NAD-dependent epimerase/dehydratase family protein, partial [Acinetobacter baumannii]